MSYCCVLLFHVVQLHLNLTDLLLWPGGSFSCAIDICKYALMLLLMELMCRTVGMAIPLS